MEDSLLDKLNDNGSYDKSDIIEAMEKFEKELLPLVNINKYAYLSIKKTLSGTYPCFASIDPIIPFFTLHAQHGIPGIFCLYSIPFNTFLFPIWGSIDKDIILSINNRSKTGSNTSPPDSVPNFALPVAINFSMLRRQSVFAGHDC